MSSLGAPVNDLNRRSEQLTSQNGHTMGVLENSTSSALAKNSQSTETHVDSSSADRKNSSSLQSPKENSYLASELNHCNSKSSSNESSFRTQNKLNNGSPDPHRDKRLTEHREEVGAVNRHSTESETNQKCDIASDCDRENKATRPDSLTGVGKRYITRSSRTPGNSDSSSSPSNTFLSRSSRLKSPLKSPSKSYSPQSLSPSLNSTSLNKSSKCIRTSPLSTGANGNYYNTSRPSPLMTTSAPSSLLTSLQSRYHHSTSPNSCGQFADNNNSPPGVLSNRQVTSLSPLLSQAVRTTKASRLRAAALDKKKEATNEEQSPITSPLSYHSRYSPKLNLPAANSSDTNKSAEESITSPARRIRIGVSALRKSPRNTEAGLASPATSKKNFSGESSTLSRLRRHTTDNATADLTLKLGALHSPSRRSTVEINLNGNSNEFIRSRTSTMNSNTTPMAKDIELSPVRSPRTSVSPRTEERDKSSKRKSNLNRALNEESTQDDDAAIRRRRRRELGMARQLIPTDETSAAIRDVLQPIKTIQKYQAETDLKSPISPRNGLAFHMENARKEVLSNSAADRRRASTASPKMGGGGNGVKIDFKLVRKSPEKCESVPLTRSLSKEYDYLHKNKRLTDVTRKVDAIRERTKSELAEIKKITAKCNTVAPSSIDTSTMPVEESVDAGSVRAADNASSSLKKVSEAPITFDIAKVNQEPSSSSRAFIKKDRISFDDGLPKEFEERTSSSLPYPLDEIQLFPQRRILKARSHDKELSPDLPKLSPILRRKSSEEQSSPAAPIVSILKKKDHTESSSASSNASPVTFSSSVVDTPTRSSKRQGILKKRSSLDESRYSRSHSPDEKSILVKTPRRNSLEETQHGILKQRSYESKSDGCPSAEPHGILKKKDSTSTPSDNHPKHVSISQAVILAAAELCKDIITSENEYDIKPILKTDSQEFRAPKPILKKKPSSETEEIRPILKTSRKSSREESDNDECVRPILKVDSPAKRRSLVDPFDLCYGLQRSRSVESDRDKYTDLPASIDDDSEATTVSVAERIKNMEKFISSSSNNTFSGAVPKVLKASTNKRDMYKSRFRTQPVTVDELNCLPPSLDIFKPGSLDSLSYPTKLSPRSLPSISPPREIGDQYSPRSIPELNSLSLSSDSGLQTGKLFEMSGLENEKAEEISATNKTESSSILKDNGDEDSLTLCESLGDKDNGHSERDISSPTGGLVRKNSVRARANMFQQLEEKLKQDTEEKCSPKNRNPIHRFSTQPVLGDELKSDTLLKTPKQNESDSEFEPSSLPLSERLKIFSSLSDANSVTSGTSPNCDNTLLKTPSPSATQTTPKSSGPKRIKLKTIGKLTMPSFLNDNNNNNTCITPDKKKDERARLIGKIKSPFIKSNNLRNEITPRSIKNYDDDDACDINFDSGKENYDNSIELGQTADVKKKLTKSATKTMSTEKNVPVVDEKIAKYFGLKKEDQSKVNCEINVVDLCQSSKCILLEVEKPTNKMNGNCILQGNDELNETRNTTLSKEVQFLEVSKDNLSNQTKRRDQSKRNRAKTVIVNTTISASDRNKTTTGIRTRAMTITNGALDNIPQPKNLITKYEDLKVTKEDLLMASKEFERIFLGVV